MEMYRVFLVSFFVVGICGVAVFGQEKVKRDPGELKAIESLRASGALVLEVAQNDPRLEVSFLQPVEKFGAGTLAPLKDIKALAALNLRAQPLNDEVSAQLAPLTGLTRLHLEKTKITDAGLVHLKGMKDLEYLNLYDTQITDKGLASLVELKKLKNLYLWQTKVTKEAANKLKEQLKGCDVNVGVEFVPLPEPKDMPKAPAKDAKAKAKDAAKDAGKEKAKDAAKDAGKEKAKEAAKDVVKEKAKS
jgi:hypothetical protein